MLTRKCFDNFFFLLSFFFFVVMCFFLFRSLFFYFCVQLTVLFIRFKFPFDKTFSDLFENCKTHIQKKKADNRKKQIFWLSFYCILVSRRKN